MRYFVVLLHDIIMLYYIVINYRNTTSRKWIPRLLRWSSSTFGEKSSVLSKDKCLKTLLITSILKTSATLYCLAYFNTPSSGMKLCNGGFSFRQFSQFVFFSVLCPSTFYPTMQADAKSCFISEMTALPQMLKGLIVLLKIKKLKNGCTYCACICLEYNHFTLKLCCSNTDNFIFVG